MFYNQDEAIKHLKQEIDEKNTRLKMIETELQRLVNESNETKRKLESNMIAMREEHQVEFNLMQKEHELLMNDLKQEKDSTIKRLSKLIEATKLENDKLVADLKEQLRNKQVSCLCLPHLSSIIMWL